jgi:hypothetical protein
MVSRPVDDNDSHSAFKTFAEYMHTAKTVFHLVDDPLVATEKALNITDPVFVLAADTVVASVFFIVSAIELQEAIEKLIELNEEYNQAETLKKKKHLEKQINICIFNVFLSASALLASITFLICTAASLSFVGMGFFPFAIMAMILVKQCSEYFMMKDELKELCVIPENERTPEQNKKIAELNDELFYKRMEITAQALITFGFLASVIALSVFSAGMAPTLFVIGGAVFGLIFKLHEKYHDNKVEKAALREENEKLQTEVMQLKTERAELRKTSSPLCQFSILNSNKRSQDDLVVRYHTPALRLA